MLGGGGEGGTSLWSVLEEWTHVGVQRPEENSVSVD